ncbi:AI-2E family transporter [Companilactobacillus allii]|uniref:AI-2E family transporter n=1 Tax=Companilactobacillus allii TaxID=1847728 RepID=A0A1P8Q487_9LACO|nr:AI-2E family transporter [Companilactobacillus allii]APX72678.1 AI-2E family transporter [Companilactobacillus allii]USQ69783.1 AI-2E family transporter [Companilactobacillus allii]
MKLTKQEIIRYSSLVAIFLVLLVYPGQILGLLKIIYSISLPLIIGAALAYCINLLSSMLEKRFWPKAKNKFAIGTRRPVALLLSIVIIIAIIAWVLRLVLPQFITAISSFFSSLPNLLNNFNKWLNNSNQASLIASQLKTSQIDWASIQSKLMKFVSSGVSGVFSSSINIFGSLSKGLFNFILAFTFAIYLVSGKEKIGQGINRVLNTFVPKKIMKKTYYVIGVADKAFSSFISGQVIEAFILGTLCALGMWIFKFPNALSIGALVGITALVPMIGAWIGGAVGFVLIAVTSPLQGILFVVYIIILQQLESNLIYPRVVGGSIGLPGIFVLAAITIGSGVAGIIGMLLGVPIAATIYQLVKNATLNKEAKSTVVVKKKS